MPERLGYLLVGLSLALFPALSQAKCNDSQRERMAEEGISRATIESVCGTASSDSADPTPKSENPQQPSFKKWVAGIQASQLNYSATMDYQTGPYTYTEVEYEFKARTIGPYARFALNDNFAIQASLLAGELKNKNSSYSTDILWGNSHFLWGYNFGLPGANIYIGAGLFAEKWQDWPTSTDTFSGISYVLGISEKWESFSLEAELTVRKDSPYTGTFRELHEQAGYPTDYANSVFEAFHFRIGKRF